MNIKRRNNFDLIRLLLSAIVVVSHLSKLTGATYLSFNRFINPVVAVDSFFILSGFLIFMSYESSNSLKSYISKRARRIFPGYIAVVVLCSIFLFSTSSVSFFEYFGLEWIKYLFFNLLTLGFIHPTLPGVFEENMMPLVNASLWTIKIELAFYIAVPLIVFLFSKTNKLRLIITIYVLAIIYSESMLWLNEYFDKRIFIQLEKQLPGQLAFFISGGCLYYYNKLFKQRSLLYFAISLALFIISRIYNIYFIYPLSLAIIVIYLSTEFPYLGNFGRYGDISYGMYIWHFPIIQLFVFYGFPDGSIHRQIIIISTILAASFLSWHLIEKRFLLRSQHYRDAEQKKTNKR